MIVEDLAAIDEVNEEKVMNILHERFNRGLYYTYIGDILVFLNPNCSPEIYGNKVPTNRNTEVILPSLFSIKNPMIMRRESYTNTQT